MQKLFESTYIRRATGVPASNTVLRAIQEDGAQQAQRDPRKYYTNRTPAVFNRPSVQFQSATTSIEESILIPFDSSNRNTYVYPNSNQFFLDFGATYHNVKRIALVSTEIPASAPVVNEFNNHMFIQTSEDRLLRGGIFTVPYVSNGTTVLFTLANHGVTAQMDAYISITGTVSRAFAGPRTVFPLDANTLLLNYATTVNSGTVTIDLGIPVADVQIPRGIYTSDTLTQKLEATVNAMQRSNGKFYYLDIESNTDSALFNCHSLDTMLLDNNPLSTTLASSVVTVSQFNHSFVVGSTVFIVNATDTGGILADTLNGTHTVTSSTSNTFTFLTNTQSNSTTTGGGNTVLSGVGLPIQIRAGGYATNDAVPYVNNLAPLVGWEPEDSGLALGSNPLLPQTFNVTNLEITAPNVMTVSLQPQPFLTVTSIASISMTLVVGAIHGMTVPTMVTVTAPDTTVYNWLATPTAPGYATVPYTTTNLAFPSTVDGGTLYRLLPVTVLSYVVGAGTITLTTTANHGLTIGPTLLFTLTDTTTITGAPTIIVSPNEITYFGADPGAAFVGATIAINRVATVGRDTTTSMVLNVVNTLTTATLGTFTFTDTTTYITEATPISSTQISVLYPHTATSPDFTGAVFTLNPMVLQAAQSLVVATAAQVGSMVQITLTTHFTISRSTIGRFTLVGGEVIEAEVIPFSSTVLAFNGVNLPASVFVGATFRHSGSLVQLSAFESFPVEAPEYYVDAIINQTSFTVATRITRLFSIPEYVFSGLVIVRHPSHLFNHATFRKLGGNIGITNWLGTADYAHRLQGVSIGESDIYFTSPTSLQIRIAMISTTPFFVVQKDRIFITDERGRPLFGISEFTIDSVSIPAYANNQYWVFWNVQVPLGSTFPGDVAQYSPGAPMGITASPDVAVHCYPYKGQQAVISTPFFSGTFSLDIPVNGTGAGQDSATTFHIYPYQTTPPISTESFLDRENQVSLSRVVGDDLSMYTLAGLPLECLNKRYHRIRLLQENYYIIDLSGYFTNVPIQGWMGGADVHVASERHGFDENRANTVSWAPTDNVYKRLDLSGDNYLLMQSPLLDTMVPASSAVGPSFAKLRLTDGPGYVCWDAFLSSPKEFEVSLTSLSGLPFQIVNPQGKLYDFNGHDYSGTLRLTYQKQQIVDSQLNSRNSDSVKKKN